MQSRGKRNNGQHSNSIYFAEPNKLQRVYDSVRKIFFLRSATKGTLPGLLCARLLLSRLSAASLITAGCCERDSGYTQKVLRASFCYSCFVNAFGHVAMTADSTNFGHVSEAGLELIPVLLGALLAREGGANVFACVGFPQTNVALVRAGQHPPAVAAELHREHALHAPVVVHLAAAAFVVLEYANAAIVRARDEFASGGREVDGHDGADEVLVHAEGGVQLAHVERVQVVVLIGSDKVERFNWIPRHLVASHSHDRLVYGGTGTHVVKNNCAVVAACGDHVLLDGVEAHAAAGVSAPLQRQKRRGTHMTPNVDVQTRGGEHGLSPMAVQVEK